MKEKDTGVHWLKLRHALIAAKYCHIIKGETFFRPLCSTSKCFFNLPFRSQIKGRFLFWHFFMLLKNILWRLKASIKPFEVPHRGVKTKLCTLIFTSKFFWEKHRRLYRVFIGPWRLEKKYLELTLFSEDNFCESWEKMWLFVYLFAWVFWDVYCNNTYSSLLEAATRSCSMKKT